METDNSVRRVTQHLRTLALAGGPGARLASVRALMLELRVGPGTVQRALDVLGREGVLEARPGQGTFVSPAVATSRPAEPRGDVAWQSLTLGAARVSTAALATLCDVPGEGVLALNAGYLPEALQATGPLAAALARATRRPGVWSRMSLEGLPELRAWFAREAGGGYQPHEVTICPGTQAANAAAFRALAGPGDAVLVESPTYLGAMAAARAAGLLVVPIPTDADGVPPDLLERAFHRTGARVFYCQPTHANPTGSILSAPRRAAVLDVVAAAGAFLIEDDWARDFHLDSTPPPPPLAAFDHGGHVVYLRSLTKSAAPGLRVGAMCARGPALERLRATRLVDDFFVPGILQETALQLVTSRDWARHLKMLRQALRVRRDLFVEALRRLAPSCRIVTPGGGLHLWIRLPDQVAEAGLVSAAARDGILLCPGRDWFPAEPPGGFIRLSFAPAEPDRIEASVARLAALINRSEPERSPGS